MSFTNSISSANQPLAPMTTAATTPWSPANASPQSGSLVTDTNSLSDDQTSLSTAGSLIAQPSADSDVRFDRVSALQQAISTGTYNISSSDVANKLIQTLVR
jgi:negative regulator of flagellin synthesis FlgM